MLAVSLIVQLLNTGDQNYAPLGKGEQEVAHLALSEAADVEPASNSVRTGARVAGHSILDHLTAGAGSADLGGVGKVANDLNTSNAAGGGRAERTDGRAGSGAEDGAEEGRHFDGLAGWMGGVEAVGMGPDLETGDKFGMFTQS